MRNKLIAMCAVLFTGVMSMSATSNANECWDDCCGTLTGHIDFLLWRPCADGIYVATKEKSDGQIAGSYNRGKFDHKYHTEHLDFDLEPGVRLGLAYQPGGDCCWDLALRWTYISPSASGSTSTSESCPDESLCPFGALPLCTNSGLTLPAELMLPGDSAVKTCPIPTDGGAFASASPDHVKGNWDLDLNIIDLEIGRRFCVGSCFVLRPHFDLRFANIDQEYTVKSEGKFKNGASIANCYTSAATFEGDYCYHEHFENEFIGVGPRFGLDARWDLGCGFGLWGDFGFALVYGERSASDKIKIHTNNVTVDPSGTPALKSVEGNDIEFKFDSSKYCNRPIADIGIGINWAMCFCECYEVGFKLGWEQHYFFNQSPADAGAGYVLASKEESGDLNLQGLVFSGSFGF